MSSGFITESEAVEARKRRQEEWEKVRTEDQPLEAPEEPYDNRPLFQRLEEQRLKKEAEFEEAHKLKNMIRGLDDDEVSFLDLVEHTKAEAAQQILLEEQKEMREFRERVSNLAESAELQRLRSQLAPTKPVVKTPPNNKLLGVVVRKRKASESDSNSNGSPATKLNGNAKTNSSDTSEQKDKSGTMKCVAVLPGLGHYDDSSTSDSDSSESEIDEPCAKRDLLGRASEHSGKKDDAKS